MEMTLGVSKANNIVTDELLSRSGKFNDEDIYEGLKDKLTKYGSKETCIEYIKKRANLLSELSLVGKTDEFYYAKF